MRMFLLNLNSVKFSIVSWEFSHILMINITRFNAWIWVEYVVTLVGIFCFVVSSLIFHIYCASFRWFWAQHYPLFPKNMCESYGKIFISKWPHTIETSWVKVVHNNSYSDVRKYYCVKTMKTMCLRNYAFWYVYLLSHLGPSKEKKVRWPRTTFWYISKQEMSNIAHNSSFACLQVLILIGIINEHDELRYVVSDHTWKLHRRLLR